MHKLQIVMIITPPSMVFFYPKCLLMTPLVRQLAVFTRFVICTASVIDMLICPSFFIFWKSCTQKAIMNEMPEQ